MESYLIEVLNMEQTINYIQIVIYTILTLIAFRIGWKIFSFHTRVTQIKGFGDYIAVLEYHMNKAYEIIHKDRILIYSLEASKLSDGEFEVVTRDFVNLVFKFIGSSLKKDLIKFYGDEDTFTFNIVEYFNTRYEEDSIRKQTIEEMSSVENMPEVQTYEQGTGT
jgi:hypothetical protein